MHVHSLRPECQVSTPLSEQLTECDCTHRLQQYIFTFYLCLNGTAYLSYVRTKYNTSLLSLSLWTSNFFLVPPLSLRFTVLFSHGNAVDLGQMSSFYIGLGSRINCNVFSYDYSGYGASSGKPSEKNLYLRVVLADRDCPVEAGVEIKSSVTSHLMVACWIGKHRSAGWSSGSSHVHQLSSYTSAANEKR